MKIKKQHRGVTLIETILYVAVISIVMNALVPMAWNVIEIGAKSSVQQEVHSTARYVSERINYEIRNSIGINSVSSGSISLIKSVGGDNPTIISLVSGNITIKRGAGTETIINSGKTLVSNLVFTNYTSVDSRSRHVQYVFTITDNYPAGRNEYSQSIDLESSVEVRGI